MTETRVVIDANVLVALVDTRDKWHAQAVILRDTLIAERARWVYSDCVDRLRISWPSPEAAALFLSSCFIWLVQELLASIRQTVVQAQPMVLSCERS